MRPCLFWDLAVAFFIGLLLASCGRIQTEQVIAPVPAPIPSPAQPTEKVILAVFGAPWCSACKQEMPRVQAAFDALPKEVQNKIDFRLYVTTGGNSNTPPDQSAADKYKAALHMSAKALPDPWRWQTFKKWVGGQFIIPAGGVVTANGTVLKSFRNGLDADEIVEFAARATN